MNSLPVIFFVRFGLIKVIADVNNFFDFLQEELCFTLGKVQTMEIVLEQHQTPPKLVNLTF